MPSRRHVVALGAAIVIAPVVAATPAYAAPTPVPRAITVGPIARAESACGLVSMLYQVDGTGLPEVYRRINDGDWRRQPREPIGMRFDRVPDGARVQYRLVDGTQTRDSEVVTAYTCTAGPTPSPTPDATPPPISPPNTPPPNKPPPTPTPDASPAPTSSTPPGKDSTGGLAATGR